MTSNDPPVHPGRVLYEQAMQPLGVSRNKLARDIDVPVGRISDIVSGKRGITPDTALRLSKYFGTDAELWMRLQSDYDLHVARNSIWSEVEPRVRAFEPASGPPAAAAKFVAPAEPENSAPEPPAPQPESFVLEPEPEADPVETQPEISESEAVTLPDTESEPAAYSEDIAPAHEDGYVPWRFEITEEDQESLDIPELEEPVFPVDPRK